jgi:GNAT superfamily N-acetyltransferase
VPGTEELRAADGTVVATFTRDDAGGVRWAILTPVRPAAEVATAAVDTLAGHRVVTADDDLVAALVARGGTVQRRGHDYAYDLARVPDGWAETPAPQGFRLTRDLDPARLAEAHDKANPPGHPDHEPGLDHEDDVRGMAEGRVIGPLVRAASWEVTHAVDGPCGAILVVERPSADDPGRTWVVDVFVHPRHHRKGLGTVLLRRALAGAKQAGYATMGLVVSDGNPARRAYDSVGFTHVRSGTNVDLPTRPAPAR